ncbi:MAG TPA: tetratricopeptide repeat protein [Chloroflexia bacterium]|jgi:predicted ATPase/transcriptional regulator with XRE-family HTH domain
MTEGVGFGAWLRLRRKELGLTSKELAQQVGCSVATIEKMEAGIRRPSRQIAELVGEFFGVGSEELQAFVEFARSEGAGDQPLPHDEAASRTPWRILHNLRALHNLRSRPNNLPAQRTVFVGREREVAALASGLRRPEVRLFTVTGPPGSGKTRLALHVAAELLEEFQDGCFFVSLAPITNREAVAPAISLALRVPQGAGSSAADSLLEHVRGRQLLLLLDNCEQVLGAAPLIADLLTWAPGLKIIATSRQAFRLYGEREMELPPMSLPDPQVALGPEELMRYEAIRLFVDRAQAAKYDFALTPGNAASVATICQRLDGLPLGIELAASHVKSLSPEEIAARLESRLELLEGGPIDLPPRHQAVRNAIAWSYDLLGEAERKLFRRLAVFHGGFTLAAVEGIADFEAEHGVVARGEQHTATAILESLASKSLVQVGVGPDGAPRYWLLATIGEYAWEQLVGSGEAEELQGRHMAYYLKLVEQAEPQLRGPEQTLWLGLLDAEYDNLRSALRYCAQSGNAYAGLCLSGGLWRFWLVRGYLAEGRGQLAAALEVAQDSPGARLSRRHDPRGYVKARAKALNGAGVLAGVQGDYEAATASLEEGLALYRRLGDRANVAGMLGNLGNIAKSQGDYDRARALQEESLAIRRESNDRQGMAASLANLGNVAQAQGDFTSARSLYEEGLGIARELGDNWGIATTLNNLGTVAHEQGDLEAARAFFEESLAMRRALVDRRGIAKSLHNIGSVAKDLKAYADAAARCRESLAIYSELGDRTGAAVCLESLAGIASLQGQAQRAAMLGGAAEALREAMGSPIPAAQQAEHDARVEAARRELGEVPFAQAWRKGRALPLEEAIALAQGQS